MRILLLLSPNTHYALCENLAPQVPLKSFPTRLPPIVCLLALRLPQPEKKTVTIGRFGVGGVAVVALLLAMDSSNTILSLVSNAWAGFGAAFGPLVLFCLYKKNLTEKAALWGIISGAITVLFWIYAPVLNDGKTLSSVIYEIVPGFIVSTATLWVVSALDTKPAENVQKMYQQASQELAEQQS